MNRKIVFRTIGGGVALLGAMALTSVFGSRPDNESASNPLEPCPDTPNCYRQSVRLQAKPEAVQDAAMGAVTSYSSFLTGRAVSITKSATGLSAVFQAGPFRDDVQIQVTPSEEGNAILHIRSASRVGRSDLGVNRARGQALIDAVQARVE